jgi:hypothetical protein
MDYAIIATAIYIVIIAIANAPKKPATQPEEIKIDSPEVEQETPEMPVIPCPWETEIEIVMIPEVKEPTIEIKNAIATLPPAKEPELETATDSLMFALMPIRKLYPLAKNAGIKNYKSMKKSELAIALAGVKSTCSV